MLAVFEGVGGLAHQEKEEFAPCIPSYSPLTRSNTFRNT